MKGRFSLNKYDDKTIIFGNLTMNNIEQSEIAFEREALYSCKLIAHDVIEHSVKHRTNKYVTVEEELRALGATQFIRSHELDISEDIRTLECYISKKKLKLPPYKALDYLERSHEDLCEILDNEYEEATTEAIRQNINYGFRIKQLQFNDCNYTARNAFSFIERNSKGLIDDLLGDYSAYGYSLYFDTSKHIFRKQNILKPKKWSNF